MKIVIGLTGPTGAGKSMVSKAAEDFGFKVIDCDKTARKAVEKGTEGLAAVVKAFGEGILNCDGTLNRKELAQRAFKDAESTELLNKTLLPFVSALVLKEADTERVLLDAPTLFESGINSVCNATVAVLADLEIRLDRIIERDGIDLSAARLRISAGKPDSFYKDRADYIIYNNGKGESFVAEFQKIITEIMGKI
ncbi:MAG: dephospho-CoA kinase [Clostridia bacterium]|nr:dephospho-CoA kinase [Clostridia bacterium]